MDSSKCIEACRSSVFGTLVDLVRSRSGKTSSSASMKAGSKINMPSKSTRNKSEELMRILEITSVHSLFYNKNMNIASNNTSDLKKCKSPFRFWCIPQEFEVLVEATRKTLPGKQVVSPRQFSLR